MTTAKVTDKPDVGQAPFVRLDGQMHPTPIEIRTAILTRLCEDAEDPNTPNTPVHVGRLVREAIDRACRGEFQ